MNGVFERVTLIYPLILEASQFSSTYMLKRKERSSERKTDTSWLEFHDLRALGQIANGATGRSDINAQGAQASERDERTRLWQSVEQADKTAIHAAERSPELRSDIRARRDDHRDEAVAQKEKASSEAKVSGFQGIKS